MNLDIKQKQQALKLQYGIKDKLALYVPTYREHHQANQVIDKTRFETALPSYTLISKLHPSLPQDKQYHINLQSLMIMADVIITDYSSLAIEASLLNKPTLFYVYDEANYEQVRGLNAYYYEIPELYKAYREDDIVHILQTHASELNPLFKNWHDYNDQNSLNQVIKHIEKMVKT